MTDVTSLSGRFSIFANTTAVVMWQPEGNRLLTVDELSPFPGVELRIGVAQNLR